MMCHFAVPSPRVSTFNASTFNASFATLLVSLFEAISLSPRFTVRCVKRKWAKLSFVFSSIRPDMLCDLACCLQEAGVVLGIVWVSTIILQVNWTANWKKMQQYKSETANPTLFSCFLYVCLLFLCAVLFCFVSPPTGCYKNTWHTNLRGIRLLHRTAFFLI